MVSTSGASAGLLTKRLNGANVIIGVVTLSFNCMNEDWHPLFCPKPCANAGRKLQGSIHERFKYLQRTLLFAPSLDSCKSYR
jgi:hypothetical protein